jgi:toxin CptA
LLLVLAWFFQGAGLLDWRIALALALCLGAALRRYGLAQRLRRANLPGTARSGAGKAPGYQAGVAEYGLSVLADFQHALLLRLENQARACLWLWVERRACRSAGWTCAGRFIHRTRRLPAMAA